MTKIYGASDDLIEFEGDVSGESGGGDEEALIVCSDGTLLTVKYADGGTWEIRVKHKGTLFDRLEQCESGDDENYTDQAFFKDGLKWAYAATDWEKVK